MLTDERIDAWLAQLPAAASGIDGRRRMSWLRISASEALTFAGAGTTPRCLMCATARPIKPATWPRPPTWPWIASRRGSKRLNKDAPVLVYCYHGNSSQEYAQMLADFRFNQVYSVDGGFAACAAGRRRSAGMNTRADVAAWAAAPAERQRCGLRHHGDAENPRRQMQNGRAEKHIMAWLYDALLGPPRPALWPDRTRADCPGPRRHGRNTAPDGVRTPCAGETTLSRPVMKTFRAMIRAQGLFAGGRGRQRRRRLSAAHKTP